MNFIDQLGRSLSSLSAAPPFVAIEGIISLKQQEGQKEGVETRTLAAGPDRHAVFVPSHFPMVPLINPEENISLIYFY